MRSSRSWGAGQMGEVYRARDTRLNIAPQFVNVSPGKSDYRTSAKIISFPNRLIHTRGR